jgi:hypothetical protein
MHLPLLFSPAASSGSLHVGDQALADEPQDACVLLIVERHRLEQQLDQPAVQVGVLQSSE